MSAEKLQEMDKAYDWETSQPKAEKKYYWKQWDPSEQRTKKRQETA
jgi:hypothetical protein